MANDPLKADLEKAVRALVAQATGLDVDTHVIPGNDNGPAPNELYASVLTITVIGDGIDSEVDRVVSGDPTQTDLEMKGSRIGVFSIQAYRTGAQDALETLLSYGASSVGQIWLAENGLTWRKAGDIRNLDSVMATKWEERRAMDLELKYTSTRSDRVNTLATVEIDIIMDDSITIEDTTEVGP